MARKHKSPRPRAPKELEGGALLAWTRYAEDLRALGALNTVDRAALATLATTTALREEAAKNMRETGPIIKLPNGYQGPTPFLKVYFEAAKLEAKLLAEFGLTPTSRIGQKSPADVPEELDI